MSNAAEPTYAIQLARPFWDLLKRHPRVPQGMLDWTAEAPDDLRVPVAAGQQFLEQMVELTGEPDLGLLAAQQTGPGAFHVVEYVSHSAPTWRDAIQVSFRYVHLMNQAADFRIEQAGDRVHLVMDSTVPLTRAGIDFQSASFFLSATRWFGPAPPDLEVWLTYDAPADATRHREVFGGARLRFGAPWNGFVQAASTLEMRNPNADPTLHKTLREHAERVLAELSPADGIVEDVRKLLLSLLDAGPVTAEAVAARLGLSRRSLSRRLSRQQTSFSALRDDVRRQAAHHYLVRSDETIDDIAFLLGFSESSVFVRAFKRWFGEAPTVYRKRHRDL